MTSDTCGTFFLLGLGLGVATTALWFGYQLDALTDTFKRNVTDLRTIIQKLENELRELDK